MLSVFPPRRTGVSSKCAVHSLCHFSSSVCDAGANTQHSSVLLISQDGKCYGYVSGVLPTGLQVLQVH